MDRHVYALDFDGVLCDSCGESSLSAVKAAKLRWPSLFADVSADVEGTILKQMREVRPVVETGYENILLVRLLLEMACEDKRQSQVKGTEETSTHSFLALAWLSSLPSLSSLPLLPSLSSLPSLPLLPSLPSLPSLPLLPSLPSLLSHQLSKSGKLNLQAILSGWEGEIKPAVMAEWGEEGRREELVELFGAVRDEWMRHDLPGWIAANAMYAGVPEALQKAESPLYIVTTKQTRFALALLRELAGVNFPEDKVFGLGTGLGNSLPSIQS
ncbi:unnamed protein product [Closterium sp. NIES-64]|nr:unnamed protein product [Closterium sp. NIES-64]CAI6003685.1 unnamed protein product [Closterium sp. NIES-64]